MKRKRWKLWRGSGNVAKLQGWSESSALSCVVRSLFCVCKSWWNTLFRVSSITSIISNWGFAFETATVDFRGKRWFPLSNATKINFYSLMKGAFSASQQTGSVSRHYPSTLITFYPLPGRNWTCGTYAPGVTAAMLVYSMLPSIRTLQVTIPITFLF